MGAYFGDAGGVGRDPQEGTPDRPLALLVMFGGEPIRPLPYSVLRNSASGPEIGLPGRILAGLLPGKH